MSKTVKTPRPSATEQRERFVELMVATGKTSLTRQEVKDLARANGVRTTVVSWFVRNPENRSQRGSYAIPTVASVSASAAPVAVKAKPAVKPAAAVQTKTPKPSKAKAATKPAVTQDDIIDETMKGAVMKDSMVFDALDEIETNIQDFEDRTFAQEYVKTL